MFTGLHADPERQERLAARLPAVCASVSASDQVTKEQLRDLARDKNRNPLNYVTKNNQSISNTCAANAGEFTLAVLIWHITKQVYDFSRLWLYLQGKLKWDSKGGRFIDDGCSIPSIAEVLLELGVPFEAMYPFNPDSRTWPSVSQFRDHSDPKLIAMARQHKLSKITPVSADFDVTVARVALGDPFFWGTGWPFPSGGSGHATSGAWFTYDESLRDFVLLMGNSHLNNEVFRCTRKQFNTVMRNNTFGAYHLEGSVDLRLRPGQLVM